MIKITISSTEVRTLSGNSKASGKPYNLAFQDAWFHLFDKAGKPDPYPTKVELMLEIAQDGAPLFHAPGEYVLHPSSIYHGRDGKLNLYPRLMKAPAPRAA